MSKQPKGITGPLASDVNRAGLLARREKNNLPWGTTSESVNAYRNRLYLSNAGAIPKVEQSARMALEVQNDNIRKANQKDQRQTARAVLQEGQDAANEKWLSQPTGYFAWNRRRNQISK